MYKNLIINLCLDDREWQEYHRIRAEQIFDPINVEYDHNHPTITANNHYHFVLKNEAALRSLAVDKPSQNKGFGKYMMQLLEKWLRDQNIKVLKMHARISAEAFYRKLGYIDMEFNDISIQKNYIDLGKML